MKIFILCGGFGSRLDYEGQLKAKPMVRIGNKPILMHLIETFVKQGFNEFVFCLGYKSNTITDFFTSQKKKIKIISNDKTNLKILAVSTSCMRGVNGFFKESAQILSNPSLSSSFR